MAKVTVNMERYKGEYTLERGVPFVALEWRWIKKISGYLPLTIDDGFEGDDQDLYIALAIIALYRAGKVRPNEALLVAQLFDTANVADAIVLDFTEDEEAEKAELADEKRADPEA